MEKLHDILKSVDSCAHGQFTFEEFCIVMEMVSSGQCSLTESQLENKKIAIEKFSKCIPVERSCGGI